MPAFIFDFSSPTNVALPAKDISIMTAVLVVGAVIGTALAAWLGDVIGRRKTLWIACVISLIGSAVQTGATNVALMTFGHTLAYTASLMMLPMAAASLGELSPSSIRGAMVAISIVSINAAGIVSGGINLATHAVLNSMSYRLPLGLQCLWPIIIVIGLFFVVDSPTYYIIKGNEALARSSLRQVRQGYSDDEIEIEIATLKQQTDVETDQNSVVLMDLFRGHNLRRTLLALSIANMQQLSGIAFATNYATVFLSQIGTANPFLLTLGLNILSVGGSIVGVFLVDSVGRRTLALSTFTALFIINTTIGGLGFADATKQIVPRLMAAFCLMFGFFYACGFGPLTYVIAAEMPTARLRNKTSAFAFALNSVFALVVALTLPYIANADQLNLGAKTYLIFSIWMLFCITIVYFCLPETRGRTPAELDELFAARVPARQFKDYQFDVAISRIDIETVKDVDVKVQRDERLD
ncbi:hypothetical protein FOXG_21711 [Fusarium oxysporum f. sp. lycopersici 4287]|nr:hypothetical protein FOXG_21711 [Fusarium oxysporum f. sp. lycopersici 4287]KNB16581.1 hypothetical protein FOXG_21711 [Fusarium oxysporum f. sp. lycopersici 4287]